MILIPKKKEESQGSAFTTDQAKSITHNTEDINSNLYGFFGTLNKRDKKKFLQAKVKHIKTMQALGKLDDNKDPKKKETNKKWFKVVGLMAGGMKKFFGAVANIAKGLASKTTGILGFLLGLWIVLKLGLLQTLIPAALEMLKELVTGIIKILPSIMKWAWEILKEWVPKLVNAFADAISDALGLGKESKLRKIMPYLVGIGAGLLAIYKAANMFGLGGTLLKGLGSLLVTVFKTLIDGLKGLKGIGGLGGKLGGAGKIGGAFGLAAAVTFTAGAVYDMYQAGQEVSKDAQEQLEQLNKDKKASAQWEKKTQESIRKNYGDLADKDKEFREAQFKSQKEIWEEVDDAGNFRVWKKGFWKAMIGMDPGGVETEKFYKKQAEYDKAIREQAFKKWGKIHPERFKKEIEAENKRKEIEQKKELKKKAIISESQKKYFNVWEKQDKTRQKKQIASLKESQKVANSYWERFKAAAVSATTSTPTPAGASQGTSFGSIFTPFLDKAKQVFREIGDFFSNLTSAILWGVRLIPGLGRDVHTNESERQYKMRKSLESRMGTQRASDIDAYALAEATNNVREMERLGASLSDEDKALADAVNEMVKANSSLDRKTGKLLLLLQRNQETGATHAAYQKFGELQNISNTGYTGRNIN